MRGIVTILTAIAVSCALVSPAAAQSTVTLEAWYGYLSDDTVSLVKRGDMVTIGVGVTVDGGAGAGYPVALWAKPYDRSWRKVDEATTAGNGRATGTHTPRYNTTYQWRYDAAAGSDPVSNGVLVRVATTVTMGLVESTLRTGQTLVARGRTYPSKPGATVTLWRKFPATSVKLATARVRSDGTYRVSRVISDNALTWTVYTTVAAWQGNAKGTSPIRTANIN